MSHASPIAVSPVVEQEEPSPDLDFVWLELTNRCNLHCVHCYAESSPYTGDQDLLTEEDYVRLLHEIRGLGCDTIQFIGGEPTLNRSLPLLIQEASEAGFSFIEVYTNLVQLSDGLLSTWIKYNVAIATSFYSHRPEIHDSVTTHPGSFHRTVKNMRRVLDADLRLRAGIILMEQNQDDLVETWNYQEALGIKNIGTDRLRKIGRANEASDCQMGELCGSCAGNILSIGPDGIVAPCNMSKAWPVGSVLKQSLSEIVRSEKLTSTRSRIQERVPREGQNQPHAECNPKSCTPYSSCCPSTQSCNPCAPNNCNPCRPKG